MSAPDDPSAGKASPGRPAGGKPASDKSRKPRKRLSREQQRRRTLLRSALVAAGLLLLHPLAQLPIGRRLRQRLRPPGALAETDFLGACIKCGQCVQVCPVECIHLADANEGFGSGTPFIDARSQACDFSCDALSCILACPTGALSHSVRTKEEVRAGVAELTRPDACLARQGKGFRGVVRGAGFEGRLRYEEIDRWNAVPVADHPYERDLCDLCVSECPIGESAIRLEPLADAGVAADREGDDESEEHEERPRAMTPVVQDGCVGCGVCEMICPQEPACIEIEPSQGEGIA